MKTVTEIDTFLKGAIVGQKVISTKYGDATIVAAYVDTNVFASAYACGATACIKASIEHSTGTVGYVLDKAVPSGNITFCDEAGIEAFNFVMNDLSELLVGLQEEAEEAKAKLVAEARAEAEAEQKKLDEIKYEENKARVLKKLATAKAEPFGKDFPINQYEVLGWMAKHCVSVRAALPDYAESWFVAHFGDVPRNVVDSHKKTSGGFAYQWGLGLRITFNEVVPDVLASKASPTNKKVIDNVAFVWDLVDNYGFQFGKKQNIDEILKYLSGKALDDFKKGYEM